MPNLKVLFALGFAISKSIALDDEFPGFLHLRNWDGGMTDLQAYKLNDGSRPTDAIMRDLCGTDSKCSAYVEATTRVFDGDGSYDMYLAFNQTMIPATICLPDAAPGCNTPSQAWMKCSNDFAGGGYPDRPFNKAHVLNTYNIPPDLMITECLKSKSQCIGVRLKNDRSGGDLLKSVDDEGAALFKIP